MPKKGSLFNGGEYVTREEFAASLVKASGQKAADSYTITNYSFKDAQSVDDAYKNLLETAVTNLYMLVTAVIYVRKICLQERRLVRSFTEW